MKMLSSRELQHIISEVWQRTAFIRKYCHRKWEESAPARSEAKKYFVIVMRKMRPASRRGYFLYVFFGIVFILLVLKYIHPEWVEFKSAVSEDSDVQPELSPNDTIGKQAQHNDSLWLVPRALPCFVKSDGTPIRHRIYSVPHFSNTFPDLNDVQLATAERLGVSPVANREQAAMRKDELVFVGANPYYEVRRLGYSIPYLVPRASRLLEHIARTFLDSLEIKGIAWNKIIVTSLLRSEEDVANLKKHNGNASDQSCHRFGTTFDISYSKFANVVDPEGPDKRQVRDDSLKWVLSEVLRDARESGLCYVKYEVKQGCFHITAR